jgi:hypothetical protein
MPPASSSYKGPQQEPVDSPSDALGRDDTDEDVTVEEFRIAWASAYHAALHEAGHVVAASLRSHHYQINEIALAPEGASEPAMVRAHGPRPHPLRAHLDAHPEQMEEHVPALESMGFLHFAGPWASMYLRLRRHPTLEEVRACQGGASDREVYEVALLLLERSQSSLTASEWAARWAAELEPWYLAMAFLADELLDWPDEIVPGDMVRTWWESTFADPPPWDGWDQGAR